MGMLDDAIRQHLELKRRSGAPEDEVHRLEAEALGPARRESAIAAPVDQPDAGELPPPPAASPSAEAPTTVQPSAAPPAPAADASPAPAEDPAPPAEPSRGSWLDDEDELAPAPKAPSAAPQETSEFTAHEAREAQGAPPTDYVAPDEEGDDLLEETPDFLQETPEHDRLWFEQKPPRGFDFDQ
jgi:hypothetical protein